MCRINDLMQDCVEWQARRIKTSNKSIDFGDLVQEGLKAIYEYAKEGQSKAYYSTIAKRAMLKFIKKESFSGVTVNAHGGDRRSENFSTENDALEFIQSVSLDIVPEYVLHPSNIGIKSSVPNYDNYDYDSFKSGNDCMAENWLNKGELW